VLVESMKPALKVPGTKRLKPKSGEVLRGKAVLVEPMKPALKVPGTKRLNET